MSINHPVDSAISNVADLLRQLHVTVDESTQEIDRIISALEEAVMKKRFGIYENILAHPELKTLWGKVSQRITSQPQNSEWKRIASAIENVSYFIHPHIPPGNSQNLINTEMLLIAIHNSQSETVQALHTLGANVNSSGINSCTPLVYAINQKNREMVKLLLKLQADPNLSDANGIAPLLAALQTPDTQTITDLVRGGADLHKPFTYVNLTPMQYALQNKDLYSFELLRSLGGNPKHVDARGYDLLTYAYGLQLPKPIRNRLKGLGLDKAESMEKLRRVELAHIWGIGGYTYFTDKFGNTMTLTLEGIHLPFARNMVIKYLELYFQVCKDIPTHKKSLIVEAFRHALFTSDQDKYMVARKILDNEPCVIFGGTREHMISLLFYLNHFGVHNRGFGRQTYSNQFYAYPAAKITHSTLDSLFKLYGNIEEFYNAIDNLNLRFLYSTNMKAQKIGNCCWADGKAAIHSLFCMMMGPYMGQRIYKEFTRFTRIQSFEIYMKESTDPDDFLINAIQAKMIRKRIVLSPYNTSSPKFSAISCSIV